MSLSLYLYHFVKSYKRVCSNWLHTIKENTPNCKNVKHKASLVSPNIRGKVQLLHKIETGTIIYNTTKLHSRQRIFLT